MKKYAVFGIAVLSVTLAGCKSKIDKFQELSDKYALAGNTMLVDCPLVNDQGQPDMGGHKNTSPKCVEEEKHYNDLHEQLLDAQREASK